MIIDIRLSDTTLIRFCAHDIMGHRTRETCNIHFCITKILLFQGDNRV